MTSRRPAFLAASALLFFAASASAEPPAAPAPDPAAAPTKAGCIAAAAEAQKLRRGGKVMASRPQFAICANDACPDVVRTDCVNWLSEVLEGTPSIVVRVRRAGGGDIVGARLKVDGVELTPDREGKPIDLDPGAHDVSVETPQGNAQQKVVVVIGEKSRVVTMEVGAPPVQGDAVIHPAVTTSRPVPVLTYILGGVAVVGGASFTFFGLRGQNEFDALEGRCGSRCDPASVSPVRTDMAIADISLAVGVVALIGGAIVYFTRPTVEAPLQTARFAPSLRSPR